MLNTNIQMEFPINRNLYSKKKFMTASNVMHGQEVLYCGNISGGPILGSKGVVTKKYANKALVDMGWLGVWNVPYYFLSDIED